MGNFGEAGPDKVAGTAPKGCSGQNENFPGASGGESEQGTCRLG